jgi:hypothetical protein
MKTVQHALYYAQGSESWLHFFQLKLSKHQPMEEGCLADLYEIWK